MKINRFSLIATLVLVLVTLLTYSALADGEAVTASLLWLNPASSSVPLGDTTDVVIQLDDVTDVYGLEMELGFDPTVLAVVDADPGQGGVQISEGVCPAPDFVLINSAENITGTIEYVVTQLLPTAPCDGGEVATIEFECLAVGTSPVTFTHSLISDPDGFNLGVPSQDGQVECLNTAPYKPSNPTPADMATEVSTTADLSWQGGDPDAGDTVTYDVYFGTVSPPTSLLCDDAATTSCDPGTLSENTTYYWQVIATDSYGASTDGDEWQFTTQVLNDPPYTPSNPTPADMATGVSTTTDLSWQGGDPDPGDTVTYDVYFGTASPPTSLLCDDAATTTCDPGTLNYETTYYWQVIASDDGGLSSPGAEWQFTTQEEPFEYVFLPLVVK